MPMLPVLRPEFDTGIQHGPTRVCTRSHQIPRAEAIPVPAILHQCCVYLLQNVRQRYTASPAGGSGMCRCALHALVDLRCVQVA
jgi:hypothetical protein